MLNLTEYIKMDKSVFLSPNICNRFSEEDLAAISDQVMRTYEMDVNSRIDWSRRTEAGLDLAMQLQQSKSFPWHNCSNIAFPLITIAALQFHSRAYPALVNGHSIVKCRVMGSDKSGLVSAVADRISTHMSWQLLEEDENWEAQTDLALLNIPIVGVGFKKTYYHPSKGYNVSEFVQAKDLVVNYWATSIEDWPAKTHVIPMGRNQIYERVRRGVFKDILDTEWFMSSPSPDISNEDIRADKRLGTNAPIESEDSPFILLEQHCSLDLDNDGYAEPYIVTVEKNSRQVLRIVARFNREEDIEYDNKGNIITIKAMEYFTTLSFIPSPDGSLMSVGFGVLLGPLNESVNTAINQLYDAGTLSNTAGGFLGRGAKIRGGVYRFSPFSWQRVDSTGDDLRKNIFPLPVREPSSVMFNLLNLLINYTNRISGTTDLISGETPGQNTPAETARTAVEQGQKVYSAIFKRIWRGFKQEFKKLYFLNSIFLPEVTYFGDGSTVVYREDYTTSELSIVPVADPAITSDAAQFARARLIKDAAANNPGYDTDSVERLFLKSLGVDAIDTIYKGTADLPPPPEDPTITIAKIRLQSERESIEFRKMQFITKLREQASINNAKVLEIKARTAKIVEEIGALKGKEYRDQIDTVTTQLEALSNQQLAQADLIQKELDNERISNEQAIPTGGIVPGVETPPSDQATSNLGDQGAGVA